jgi:hypothetical protein
MMRVNLPAGCRVAVEVSRDFAITGDCFFEKSINLRTHPMNKLVAGLVAGLFAAATFAASHAGAPMAAASGAKPAASGAKAAAPAAKPASAASAKK